MVEEEDGDDEKVEEEEEEEDDDEVPSNQLPFNASIQMLSQ